MALSWWPNCRPCRPARGSARTTKAVEKAFSRADYANPVDTPNKRAHILTRELKFAIRTIQSIAWPVPRDSKKNEKNVVNSLAKGFRVLEAFTSDAPELVLAEIARRANLDNATTFRLLNTLVMLGYVEKVEDTRKFRLTLKCLDLGFNAIGRSDLRTQARPVLRSLVGEVNEAASIGVLEGAEVVYIERMQAGMTRLGVDVRIGSRVPVHSTAIGHAIVGFQPRAEQDEDPQGCAAQENDRANRHRRQDVIEAIQAGARARVRSRRPGERTGLCVLAAPILDIDGFPVAGSECRRATRFACRPANFEKSGCGAAAHAAQQLSRGLNATGSASIPPITTQLTLHMEIFHADQD